MIFSPYTFFMTPIGNRYNFSGLLLFVMTRKNLYTFRLFDFYSSNKSPNSSLFKILLFSERLVQRSGISNTKKNNNSRRINVSCASLQPDLKKRLHNLKKKIKIHVVEQNKTNTLKNRNYSSFLHIYNTSRRGVDPTGVI